MAIRLYRNSGGSTILSSLRHPGLSGFMRFRILVAMGFSSFFLFTAVAIGGLAAYEMVHSLHGFVVEVLAGGEIITGFISSGKGDQELITGFIKGINTAIIAMAAFELGMGISKEYGNIEDEGNLYFVVRRGITRFVSLVCVALVLEALIMVIKYSQLELAGNLGYPVALIAGASLLLLSLGGFLALTAGEGRHPHTTGPVSGEQAEWETDQKPVGTGGEGTRSARLGLASSR